MTVWPRVKPGSQNGLVLSHSFARKLMPNGYIYIYLPASASRTGKRGWRAEHRWVIETLLERDLDRLEEVHHRNGDKTDNHPANLELLDSASHKLHHRKVDRERVCDLYKQGLSTREVGTIVGCSGSTASLILAAEGCLRSKKAARRLAQIKAEHVGRSLAVAA